MAIPCRIPRGAVLDGNRGAIMAGIVDEDIGLSEFCASLCNDPGALRFVGKIGHGVAPDAPRLEIFAAVAASSASVRPVKKMVAPSAAKV
jgi:hypothetical protein